MEIIIIAHKYKPYNRVGGIRWINLVENLKKKDFKIHLITVPRGGKSSGDVVKESENLLVYYTSSDYYYKIFENLPKSYLGQVITYGAQKLGSLIWYDDNAQYWYHDLKKVFISILDKHPEAISLATGAPFQACYHLMRICQEINYQKFVLDFQDPWSKDPYRKYFNNIMRNKVNHFENETLNCSRNNIFVTNGLLNLMKKSNQNNIIIENGHDFYDIPTNNGMTIRNKTLKILYLGTLANGRDKVLINFLSNLENDTNIQIQIDVYGRASRFFIKWCKSDHLKNTQIILENSIPRNQISHLAQNYNVGLQLNSFEYPFLVSTKIYEYPALGLPVLSINGGGDVEELIVKHQIGISLNMLINWEKKISYVIEYLNGIHLDNLILFSRLSSWKSRSDKFEKYLIDSFQ